jgi:hypothetical protein
MFLYCDRNMVKLQLHFDNSDVNLDLVSKSSRLMYGVNPEKLHIELH